MTLYDFNVKDRAGNPVSLADYKGQVVLIVNTATRCGFTSQYEELQRLYEDYKGQGFAILDFPCNQFADQAPGSNEEIHSFCTGRFGITFPQYGKIEVNGSNADPLYTWLKDSCERETCGGVFDYILSQVTPDSSSKEIRWNFTKFLVGRDGQVITRMEPNDKMIHVRRQIAEALRG